MSLSDIFNDQRCETALEGDTILRVTYKSERRNSFPLASDYYDFSQRRILTFASHSCAVTPFAQADREVLEMMHEKLVSLGGHPPPLPVLEPPEPKKPKGLVL
jgi:hypothetical protein